MIQPVGIACSDQGYLFIADKNLPFVTKINDNGEVISKIQTTQRHGNVVNVSTFGDILYVGQEKCITKYRVSLSDLDGDIEEYHPDVKQMYDFDAVDEQNVYCY